ncbi:hypothetical protein AB6A40_005722 [Gnathostoma spinigerum]|uniref:Synembryn n=1 Tax=Gnathostoma spinigerum TaxID=75299 RepID=A0ABD6EG93_9BILA
MSADSQSPLEWIAEWQSLSDEKLCQKFSLFNEVSAKKFNFDDISVEARSNLSACIEGRIVRSDNDELRKSVLTCLRMIARGKYGIDVLFTKAVARFVIDSAQLTSEKISFDSNVLIEAEMCLINALFNSSCTRNTFQDDSTGILLSRIRCITKHLPSLKLPIESDEFPYLDQCDERELQLLHFYDFRIAFVSSAHIVSLRHDWSEPNKCKIFVDALEVCLSTSDAMLTNVAQTSSDGMVLDRAKEILKILFNIFYRADSEPNDCSERCVLLCKKIVELDKVDHDLEQNAVNLLAVLPNLLVLLAPKTVETVSKNVTVYNGYDVTVVDALLKSINRQVQDVSPDLPLAPNALQQRIPNEFEMLGTYFTVLIVLCSKLKEVRRYTRSKVIPPLRATDVERRPEEGNELRNKVIRVMASSASCRELAGEFLFVLSKRSVNRFMKYTGFGNAAGLLANYGFLGRINEQRRPSDSEDSETEDYKEVEHQVNPVTGWIEPEKEKVWEGMSDEQKEYEAVNLMNAMSRLMDQGMIKPGTVGDDGRIREVSHVLELCKDTPEGKKDDEGSESDVD